MVERFRWKVVNLIDSVWREMTLNAEVHQPAILGNNLRMEGKGDDHSEPPKQIPPGPVRGDFPNLSDLCLLDTCSACCFCFAWACKQPVQ